MISRRGRGRGRGTALKWDPPAEPSDQKLECEELVQVKGAQGEEEVKGQEEVAIDPEHADPPNESFVEEGAKKQTSESGQPQEDEEQGRSGSGSQTLSSVVKTPKPRRRCFGRGVTLFEQREKKAGERQQLEVMKPQHQSDLDSLEPQKATEKEWSERGYQEVEVSKDASSENGQPKEDVEQGSGSESGSQTFSSVVKAPKPRRRYFGRGVTLFEQREREAAQRQKLEVQIYNLKTCQQSYLAFLEQKKAAENEWAERGYQDEVREDASPKSLGLLLSYDPFKNVEEGTDATESSEAGSPSSDEFSKKLIVSYIRNILAEEAEGFVRLEDLPTLLFSHYPIDKFCPKNFGYESLELLLQDVVVKDSIKFVSFTRKVTPVEKMYALFGPEEGDFTLASFLVAEENEEHFQKYREIHQVP